MADQCKYVLIGKFSQGIPTFKTLQSKFNGFGLKSSIFFGLVNMKHIMIKLSNEEDFLKLWTCQFIHIEGYPMQIFKWMPLFDPKAESSIVPLSICFPKLPLYLFDKKTLFSIAMLIGKPLRIDEPTADRTRPNVARVYVELNLLQPMHEEIYITCSDHVVSQWVIYEKVPNYCSKCRYLGHTINICFNKEYRHKLAN